MASYLKTIVRARIERQKLLEKIHGRQVRLMRRVGAYGMTVMRRQLRPQKSERGATQFLRATLGGQGRARKVTIAAVSQHGHRYNREVIVPVEGFGRVLDAKSGRPVSREDSEKARLQMRILRKAEGAGVGGGPGQPPRRGPTDLLRKFTLWDVVEERGNITAVIGAEKFAKQPRLVGVSAVPELLEKGGGEYIGSQLVAYSPHPFAAPSQQPTINKMPELIAQTL